MPRTPAVIGTAVYEVAHNRAPRGRGTWVFETTPTMTLKECRRQYGDAHDAHMQLNNECPWCGFARVEFTLPYGQAARRVRTQLGPGPWTLMP